MSTEPWMSEWLTAYADRDDISTIDMIVIDRIAEAIKEETDE